MSDVPTASKHLILIVDDDSAIRETLESAFQKAGYKTAVAANGMHAITKLNSGFSADLIITDLVMPGMNGVELLKHVRADNKYKHLPVMMMTATKDRDLVLSAVSLGLTLLFVKPLNYEDVFKKVQNFLASKDNQAA